MNIPAIVIEKSERVGDIWRKRYPTLVLHTIRDHHQSESAVQVQKSQYLTNAFEVLYQPYPHNWPTFTPRDKMADWLEAYSISQDLVIWTKSQIEGQPVYRESEHQWDVTIDRDGKKHTIHPVHIVMATGTINEPNEPKLLGQTEFSGTVLHSSRYPGGAAFFGKRVVVVGAGNSAIDICQDLCFHKAQSVTMVQRTATCVTSGDSVAQRLAANWPKRVPVEYGDFRFGSQPMGLLKKIMQSRTNAMWEGEKELFSKLRKGGVALTMGPEGQGQFLLVWERLGGT